jgi:sulfite reductase beta subunit-like hemoprotein
MTDAKTRRNKVEGIKDEKDGLDVLADILRHAEAGDYDAIPEDDVSQRFKWFGCYRQKPNTGHFMLRIKIPGGQLSPEQLRAIGQTADARARGFGDVTTRQTIQLHWLTISDLGETFRMLESVGMDSQFACGDAPRNIVSCPLAGVLENEIIDASATVRDVAAMYKEGGHEFSNLPRKFKTSIGGCGIHCHQPQINDIGLFGVRRGDEVGYGLLVGGGLSSTPHFAQPMRVFVRPEQVTDVCRAIAVLFRDDGYREKRTRARLKFLVADKGWEWTRDRIEQILGYRLEHDESILHPPAMHDDHTGIQRQRDGRFAVGVPIERGRLTARAMIALADAADRFAEGEKRIRLTNKQNASILDVPESNLEAICDQLGEAGLAPERSGLRQSLVSCTGSEFCNLAVVETKHRAGRVLKWLEDQGDLDEPLMISFTGCPNACAQYQIADIGLTGSLANDPDGALDAKGKPLKVDAYNVTLGAGLGEDPQFGDVIAKKVVADRVHLSLSALLRAWKSERIDEDEPFRSWARRTDPETLEQLIVEPTRAPDAEPLLA